MESKWAAVLGMLIINFFYGGLWRSFTMFYPAWVIRYNATNAQISAVYSVFENGFEYLQQTQKFLMIRVTLMGASRIV